ncbi:MAG: glutathione S-transferase N-terminal domain-containing protein [Panacagrimonas sp.]
MSSAFDFTTSLFASTFRGWRGSAAFKPAREQPEKLLELYEFEASPYCRLVREVLTELDLDAMICPCPAKGTRFRPRAEQLGGKQQFPFLVDPNTGDQLHESADIVDHLHRHYGDGKTSSRGVVRAIGLTGSYAATLSRAIGKLRGARARPSREPEEPLELYSFEASPYSRPVRERLSELELPYRLRNFGKSRWEEMGPPFVRRKFFPDAPLTSPNRIRMYELTGRSQVPYLIDPNTDTAMYESSDILRYLEQTYAL